MVECEERAKHSTEAQEEGFKGVRVFGRHANGRRILVMDLVDVFVPHAPMQQAVHPIEVEIFHKEGEDDAHDDLGDRGKLRIRTNANVGRHLVENEHHGDLKHHVAHCQSLDALPMRLPRNRHILLSTPQRHLTSEKEHLL